MGKIRTLFQSTDEKRILTNYRNGQDPGIFNVIIDTQKGDLYA